MSALRALRFNPALAVLVAAAAAPAVLLTHGDHANAFALEGAIVAAVAGVILLVCAEPVWALGIGVVLSIFSGNWRDMGLPLPVDRIAVALAIAIVVMRELRAGRRLATGPIHWLLSVAAIYALVSAIVAGTITHHESLFALLDRFGLVPFVLFFVTPLAIRGERERRILLGMLVGLGAYLGLTSLFETTGASGLVVPHYIADPTLGIQAERARGPFLEATENGLAMYACAVAAAIAFVTWRDWRWRVLAAAVALLCLLGDLFTVTRAVWLGAVVASIVALLATRRTRRVAVPLVLTVTIATGGALLLVPGLSAKAKDRASQQSSLWDRNNSNAAAVRMLLHKPLLGFGWGRFASDSSDYYRQSPDYPLTSVRNLHNVYLANAVELGLVGGSLWLLALLTAVGAAILRRGPPGLGPWKVGLIAVAVAWAVAAASTPASYTFPTLILWIWAGVAWGPTATARRQALGR